MPQNTAWSDFPAPGAIVLHKLSIAVAFGMLLLILIPQHLQGTPWLGQLLLKFRKIAGQDLIALGVLVVGLGKKIGQLSFTQIAQLMEIKLAIGKCLHIGIDRVA